MINYIQNKLKSVEYSKIEPQGWIYEQLGLQMEGITRDLDENWGSVSKFSDWIGGTDNGWERPPYWLDGLVPLAYLLKDKKGMTKAKKWVKWSLKSQREDGDFGPTYRTDLFEEALFWPKFVMLKVFITYYEATYDQTVLEVMTRYFKFCLKKLETYEMSGWAEARGGDLTYSILWLYDKTKEAFLLELAEKVNEKTLNWTKTFEKFPFTNTTDFYYKWEEMFLKSTRTSLYQIMQYHLTHIVNVTMGIKQPLMCYRLSQEKQYLDAIYKGLEALYKYHGQVAGVFSGDEHLNGNSPTQGTELCSVVEYMFSLQVLFESTGDTKFADLLERVAYNALPATITEDFKGHQYDQQANQVMVTLAKRNWYNNDPDSNLFGFEPNFGCCLANMHQGWPKFIKNAFFTGENGIYTGVYMPVKAELNWNNQKIMITSDTLYPFNERVKFTFNMEKETNFVFHMRRPEWCQEIELELNGKRMEGIKEEQWIKVDHYFKDGDCIILCLKMPIKTKKGWYNNGITVERGPIIYALKLEEQWEKLNYGTKDFPDYEIYPKSPWNYALKRDEPMTVNMQDFMQKQIFSYQYPPVVIHAKASKLVGWELEKNSAGELPMSPVNSKNQLEEIELIPYGCAKLRISLFPWY